MQAFAIVAAGKDGAFRSRGHDASGVPLRLRCSDWERKDCENPQASMGNHELAHGRLFAFPSTCLRGWLAAQSTLVFELLPSSVTQGRVLALPVALDRWRLVPLSI